MFGLFKKRNRVAITKFKRGGEESVSSHCEGNFTKNEVMKMVDEWWDCHGTGMNDYPGLQIMFKDKKEVMSQCQLEGQ